MIRAHSEIVRTNSFSASMADGDDLLQEGTAGDIFRKLGAEPIINCTGVRTLYGGGNPTEAVIAAMNLASRAFVDLNELAEAIGRKLASLTGAEWGFVTAGSVAALSQAIAACVAGNDPEKMKKLPLQRGKMVVVAADQRMPYEAAIRAVGCTVTAIKRASDLDDMPLEDIVAICLVGHDIPTSALPFEQMAKRAKGYRIPLIVDAAGLAPTFPNTWLLNGADLLIHSGGKYIRGPQSTGFLLGSKRLCRAAYLNGPPGQSFGRSMKVGKDEIVGAYVALEQWVAGGEAARAMNRWRACIAELEHEFLRLPELFVERIEPDSAFCNPRIAVSWDRATFPICSQVIAERLSRALPRIILHDYWHAPQRIVVDPTNLTLNEAKIVGRSIVREIAAPSELAVLPAKEALNVSGHWELSVEFLHGAATHEFVLFQDGQTIAGNHFGTEVSGVCHGTIVGPSLTLISRLPGDPMGLDYEFEGILHSDLLTGVVHLGASTPKHNGLSFRRQFGHANWSGRRVGTSNNSKGGDNASC
ncbi:hypothetical protein [Sinorhizobium terangae]|uniref:hypothetical protein n=1 Tax=Sinorhizobium terangae TaxID=110322 RepID=UPI0024B0E871|nr:hypothetical protein [Sinorhizobium terangae]WFU51753.1 hypothetical protein QA637_30275 [Sinorhizobium terangae]